MATRIKYEGNDSVRRYPRTLQEAFPRDHAIWHHAEPRVSVWDLLCWAAGVGLLLAILFAPTIWRHFNA